MRTLFGFVVIASAALLLVSQEMRAELPSFVYKERQDVAPEALTIEVKSVKTSESQEPTGTRTSVTAEAQVQNVERTATDVKKGATIQIKYTHFRPKVPDPSLSEATILEVGQVGPAYLMQLFGTTTYMPAAGGFTFRKVE